jgi:pimeloyl-ACP methyl ester carboxylesterase
VYAPALTGLGDRAHLASDDIDLETHVADVTGLLEAKDLHAITLVAHSYGGAVATVVADRVPSRLAHLIYLDALVPRDGESVNDLRRAPVPEGWILPPGIPVAGDARVRRRIRSLGLTPQPPRTFSQPARLLRPTEAHPFLRAYIRPAGRHASPGYDRAASVATTEPGWTYYELPGGHNMMLTNAAALADLLVKITDTAEVL